ncbi:MAG TPA: hypothetical protein VG348_15815 [Acidimicrobiia bacterium]|jgi:hypothetical protein|nr:hypothetical protein [Acidimicrobiia bacterium]
MTAQPRISASDGHRWVPVRELKPGDALNTHQDVYWEVVRVSDSARHPGCVVVEVVHDRRYTYAPDELVKVSI